MGESMKVTLYQITDAFVGNLATGFTRMYRVNVVLRERTWKSVLNEAFEPVTVLDDPGEYLHLGDFLTQAEVAAAIQNYRERESA